jgi:hypothetical protein
MELHRRFEKKDATKDADYIKCRGSGAGRQPVA